MENELSEEDLEKALAYVCHFVRKVRKTPIDADRVRRDGVNLSVALCARRLLSNPHPGVPVAVQMRDLIASTMLLFAHEIKEMGALEPVKQEKLAGG